MAKAAKLKASEVANEDTENLSIDRYKPEVAAQLVEVESVIADLAGYEISTEEQSGIVGEVVKAAKIRWQEIEIRRKAIVDPLNKAKEAVQELFKPPLTKWATVERIGKDKLASYFERCAAERRAAEEKAAKAFETGADPAEVRALVTASAQPTQTAPGISSRLDWVAEVTDPMALLRAVVEGVAPMALVSVNNPALQQLARATKGTLAIPGVKFETRTVVSARA